MLLYLKKALAFAILSLPVLLFGALALLAIVGLVKLFMAEWIVGLAVVGCFAFPAIVISWREIEDW